MKRKVLKALTLMMSLAMLAAIALPMSVSAAGGGETINLDYLAADGEWTGDSGTNWSFFGSSFTITGNVTFIGSTSHNTGLHLNIANPDTVVTWAATYRITLDNDGTAVYVGNFGIFNMVGGLIEAQSINGIGGISALTIAGEVRAVIYNGELAASNGANNYAVRTVSNATVVINDAVNYYGSILTNWHDRGVVLSYTPGTYNIGEQDNIQLISNGGQADGLTYAWASENGVGGIRVSMPGHGYFIPVTNVTVATPKTNAPTVKKEVWNNDLGGWGAWENANIGRVVDYRITTTVPDTTSHGALAFIVHNSLEMGLTLNSSSVLVKINGATISTADYALNIGWANGDSFAITFNPAIFAYYNAGDAVEIFYSATLNQNAVIGAQGNMGEAVLEYSTDNLGGTAQTAKAKTTVYTFDLDIFKYTGILGSGHTALANAEFELRSIANDPATAIDFVLESAGNAMNRAIYRYATSSDMGKTQTLITPESGNLNLWGLDAGTYYLIETKAPAGYNKLEHPIVVEIIHADGNGISILTVNGAATNPKIVNVQNNIGVTLPSTGGVGNTAFIITGLSIMAFALILLLAQKRKFAKDEMGGFDAETQIFNSNSVNIPDGAVCVALPSCKWLYKLSQSITNYLGIRCSIFRFGERGRRKVPRRRE